MLHTAANLWDGSRESLAQQSLEQIGTWFSKYLAFAGYHPETHPALLKHTVFAAFPVLNQQHKQKHRPQDATDSTSAADLEHYLVNAERCVYSTLLHYAKT